ncbi:MAG: S-methyl-5'-thioadenosine phosphorylase, partial [Dehalococcoidia bacterium]|nr:S-methyl-5'-thioadenosine phosphorylase [Dehalococcoidia bacterium]
DYDVWHESEEPVTVDMVVSNLLKNVETSKQVVRTTVDALPIERSCPCPIALRDAIITQRDRIPGETRQRLDALVGKYLS